MTKDAIAKVKEVEAQAAKIRQTAVNLGKERVALSVKEGKQLCERAEKEGAARRAARLKQAQEEARALLAEAERDAEREAHALSVQAQEGMDAAVGFLVREVMQSVGQ